MKALINVSVEAPTSGTSFKLLLRRWRLDDVNDVFSLVDRNRQYLAEWLPWVENTTSVDDSKKFVERSIEEFDKGNRFEYGLYIIEGHRQTTETLVGTVGLVSVANHNAEIGYWLSKEKQGKGLIVTAVKELICESHRLLGIKQFVIKTLENNFKSRKIPEKLGFVMVGFSDDELILNEIPRKLILYEFQHCPSS